jgi:hypothetical protein
MPSRLLATLNPQVIARDGRVCQYCGTTDAFSYSVDHIISRSQGGPDHIANLVVACQRCNILKRGEVWIPRNFEQITMDQPEWYEQVLAVAVPAHGPQEDKPYTYRLNIEFMNEFEAWCKARKLGKGPVIAVALREYMARHGEG